MRMFYFDVIVKVTHDEISHTVVLFKGARAADELTARRKVLDRLLEKRFQVVRIDRVRERYSWSDVD
jgi:hypothetical protein